MPELRVETNFRPISVMCVKTDVPHCLCLPELRIETVFRHISVRCMKTGVPVGVFF